MYIILLFYHLIQSSPTTDQTDCRNPTTQDAPRCAPGRWKVVAGKVTACGSTWGCRNAEAFLKKISKLSKESQSFYFQGRKRLYFRGVTRYPLQRRWMPREWVCLLAGRGAGAGSAATRRLVSLRGRGPNGARAALGCTGTAVTAGSQCFPVPPQLWQRGGALFPAIQTKKNSSLKLYNSVRTKRHRVRFWEGLAG